MRQLEEDREQQQPRETRPDQTRPESVSEGEGEDEGEDEDAAEWADMGELIWLSTAIPDILPVSGFDVSGSFCWCWKNKSRPCPAT